MKYQSIQRRKQRASQRGIDTTQPQTNPVTGPVRYAPNHFGEVKNPRYARMFFESLRGK